LVQWRFRQIFRLGFAQMFFASFSTLLACVFWLLARDWLFQVARTFAREVLQRVGRRAQFNASRAGRHRSAMLQRFGFGVIVLANVFACRVA
jgi:hypothetical protein